MHFDQRMNRRQVLGLGAALAAAPLPPEIFQKKSTAWDPDEGVTAPEDLMKEHGVLNRCLLIYEEGLRRLREKKEVTPEVFQHTAQLVRTFVEEYHEKNEEKYIFPEFEKARKLLDLVTILKKQHEAGRRVTAEILRLSQPGLFGAAESRRRLVVECEAFIRMYRPHEAREDTVLFPALRTILRPKQVEALGDRMEEEEHKVLGNEGFERSVDKVAAIEKQLGIYDLKQFTPAV
ncbi:MAG TPA: hemerythrin domain-containing protein [Acidobacteriota bacterium]|jgi:hemerythrin-like domain-containing protein|nr:hemerythrin domain-containing protein [Acidobacteriota bacterium]